MLDSLETCIDQAAGLRKLGFGSYPDVELVLSSSAELCAAGLRSRLDALNTTALVLDGTINQLASTLSILPTAELFTLLNDGHIPSVGWAKLSNHHYFLSATLALGRISRGTLAFNELLSYVSSGDVKVDTLLIVVDKRSVSEVLTWCPPKTALTVCIDRSSDSLTHAYGLLKGLQLLAPELNVSVWAPPEDQQALEKFLLISNKLLGDTLF